MFYKGSRGYYCRRCVSFKRMLLDEDIEPFAYEVNSNNDDHHFDYELTVFQKELSLKCAELICDKDVLLKCVCGAGKTEIVVESIASYIKKGKKVAYAISRKEVVIELAKRFQSIFKKAKVISLYGGHHKELSGDLIICTTHQLFRYYKTFDLLILDEVDAYPLSGNDGLMQIALNSCKGHIIFSTATTNDFLMEVLKKRKYEILKLAVRPSLKPLIIPKVSYHPVFFQLIHLYVLMKKMKEQCLIFVTSKKECLWYYRLFKLFFNCTYVYASLDKRRENIDDFRNKKFQFIFTTTVLERGITIKDVNVIILAFQKNIFSEGSLVQMLGRVGRSITNPYGKAYILANSRDNEINKTMAYLKAANKDYEMSVLSKRNHCLST